MRPNKFQPKTPTRNRSGPRAFWQVTAVTGDGTKGDIASARFGRPEHAKESARKAAESVATSSPLCFHPRVIALKQLTWISHAEVPEGRRITQAPTFESAPSKPAAQKDQPQEGGR